MFLPNYNLYVINVSVFIGSVRKPMAINFLLFILIYTIFPSLNNEI